MRAGGLVTCHSLALSLFVIADVGLFASGSDAQDSAARWSALGYPRLPEGFPDDDLPVFEGLNLARGKWTFEGETGKGEVMTPLKAELKVTASPVAGMYSGWAMILRWPADSGDQALQYTIMGTPSKTGFQWGLFVIDLEALRKQVGTKTPGKPTRYVGAGIPIKGR